MKIILMLATLSILTGPVLAGQTIDRANSNDECLKMHRIYLSAFETSKSPAKEQVVYFAETCLPDSAHDEGARYKKLLQLRNNDERILTIQAHLEEQSISGFY